MFLELMYQDIFNENMNLSQKLCSLEGKNICLQNIKRELLEQLDDARTTTKSLEQEITQLKENVIKIQKEKGHNDCKIKRLEVVIFSYFFYLKALILIRMSYMQKKTSHHHQLRLFLQNHFYPTSRSLLRRKPSDQYQCQGT